MGFRYRKSKHFGPFHINLSKSVVGWSLGGKWFRYTKKANGGNRTTASIPGSGISWVKDSSRNDKIKSTSHNILDRYKYLGNTGLNLQKVLNSKIISTKTLLILSCVIIIASIFF